MSRRTLRHASTIDGSLFRVCNRGARNLVIPVTETLNGGEVQGLALRAKNVEEPSTLERVFLDHKARVFRAAFRVTGNAQDAEDVLQTVFLRLARQGETPPPLVNPSSYVYRAAINSALDVLRARRERASVPLAAARSPSTD